MPRKKKVAHATELMDRALAVRFASDAGEGSLRDYLYELLSTLWAEEESFSGKRPFGNSGWQYQPIEALIEAGIVADEVAAQELMPYLIAHALAVEVL